jgi:hypothetical protein
MKKLLLAAAFGLLRFVLASFSAMAEGNSGVIPTPDQVAEYVVGKWRYGFFRVEYMPIDSSGTGHVSAAGKKGVYIPGRCGPGDKGNMLLRTDDEEACVVVQFVDGIQIIKFPPRGSSAAQEVQLHPVR